jgi:hypothetical protein
MIIESVSILILIYIMIELWKKYRYVYYLIQLKNEIREYIKKLVKVPSSTKLILSYTYLRIKEEQISQDIYDVFDIWPVNVGSLVFACWTEGSNLDLAIGYNNHDEFERIMAIAKQYNVQKVNGTFFGQQRVNYVINSLVQQSDKFSSQIYDVDFNIQIRQMDEIEYLIKGARVAISQMNSDKHIEWNLYKNEIDNWRNVLILKDQFYEKFILELY